MAGQTVQCTEVPKFHTFHEPETHELCLGFSNETQRGHQDGRRTLLPDQQSEPVEEEGDYAMEIHRANSDWMICMPLLEQFQQMAVDQPT